MRLIRRFLFPDGLVAAVGITFMALPSLRSRAADLSPAVLLVATLVGALLAVRFHRGRQLLAMLVVALIPLALTEPMLPEESRAAFAIVAVLLPLLVAALSLLPERGALTNAGLLRLGVLAGLATIGWLLVSGSPVALAETLDARVLPPALTSWTTLPPAALIAGALALLLLLIVWLREPSPVARGLWWSLAVALAALHAWPDPPAGMVGFAAASLVLAASVVESSYTLAYHDGLTGLPGRRALNEALHEPAASYSIAMVDVDHFKDCNDRWGHDVGDQVLKMVAARLDAVGGGGRAFRYGGEEFAVVFSGMDASAIMPHLEALRLAVEDSRFVIRRRPRPRRKPAEPRPAGRKRGAPAVSVTISIGVAEGDCTTPAEAVIKRADEALYRAKQGGRNRIQK